MEMEMEMGKEKGRVMGKVMEMGMGRGRGRGRGLERVQGVERVGGMGCGWKTAQGMGLGLLPEIAAAKGWAKHQGQLSAETQAAGPLLVSLRAGPPQLVIRLLGPAAPAAQAARGRPVVILLSH